MYCAYVCTHTEYMNYPQKVIYCAYACMCMYAACVCVFYTAGNVLCVTHYIGGSGRVGGWPVRRTVCCSVVQCGAVWCSVVQCGAVWCSVVQCVAMCCSVLQCVAVRERITYSTYGKVCCNVLNCVAVWESKPCYILVSSRTVCCSVLQGVAVWCSVCSVLQCGAVCCSVFKCVAVCCSVLPCVAVCCSVLQCVAVCCSVLQCERARPVKH